MRVPTKLHMCNQCKKAFWAYRNCQGEQHYCGGVVSLQKEFTAQKAIENGADIRTAAKTA